MFCYEVLYVRNLQIKFLDFMGGQNELFLHFTEIFNTLVVGNKCEGLIF